MIAAVLVLAAAAVFAPPTDSVRVLGAHRVAAGEQVPVVDGRLNDAVWAAAPVAGDFVQQRPHVGQPASQRTEARVVYDGEAVYVGIRAWDTAPDSIAAQLGRRDVTGLISDYVQVMLDSYHDRRTAFRFAVSPRGVKRDALHYDDNSEDPTWDGVWEAQASMDSAGWSAEFRIPFSQLRYRRSAGEQTWGINFIRDLARGDERSYWSPTPPGQGRFVSQFGTLTGMRGLTSPRRLELLPYTLGRVTADGGVADGDPFRDPTQPSMAFGADLKYGLTSNLTLTATLNPDFGQVEADPSRVNLSAFETRFDERRPFFLEGVDVFNFGLGGSEALFYSRRIGRQPQGGVGVATAYVDAPTSTTILGAAKLTGRTSGGWTVGVLNAVTAEEKTRYVLPDADGVRQTVTEPLTNYAVGRVRRDFRRGLTSVGAIVTSVHRRLEGTEGLDFLPGSAWAGGIDWRHRFGNAAWQFDGFLLQSSVRGDTLAIQRLQRSPARYFQRPDADYVEYDPRRTALNGSTALLALDRIAGAWQGGSGLVYRSPGFEANDMGFLNNADRVSWDAYVRYNRFQPIGPFRSWNLYHGHVFGWTTGGDRISHTSTLSGSFTLESLWNGSWGVARNARGLSISQLRGGPAIVTPASYEAWGTFSSDRRRRVSFGADLSAWSEAGTDGGSFTFGPFVTIRPSSRLDLQMGPDVTWNRSAWQYVGTRADAGAGSAPRWVFARLDQTTASLTARLNYVFTPDLTLQLYAQPFVSAGGYDGFMEVDDPRAEGFGERFRELEGGEIRECRGADGSVSYGVRPTAAGCGQEAGFAYRLTDPDFNIRQLNTNAVLRWEYRPGSTLFVVWSQGRDDFEADGRFRPRRDAGELFRAPGTHVLLIKASYWLNL
jgi:hypothetical protein